MSVPTQPKATFEVFFGPSLRAPFAAVIASFTSPFATRLPAKAVARRVTALLPEGALPGLSLPSGDIAFERLVAALTKALHDPVNPMGLPVDLEPTGGRSFSMVAGHFDPVATQQACSTALTIAFEVFANKAPGKNHKHNVDLLLQQTRRTMLLRQPSGLDGTMNRAARSMSIPVYAVSPGSALWQYGQGRAGWMLSGTATHRDSPGGTRLAKVKFLSSVLVTRLGFPVAEQEVANSPEIAVQKARKLGFPVVAKPADGAQGRGVTANITSSSELRTAFATARAVSELVIVERHIQGDDHRLVAIGGAFKWAIQRLVPRVVGNGRDTLAELMEAENRGRSDADMAEGFVKRLSLDADMRAVIAKQGVGPDDTPADGQVVRLRDIANTSTGATIADCTERVHPDNREMCETIARGFRLDVVGMDFMTPDISKSWREVDCAIIEVNTKPGVSSDERARFVLSQKFPDGANGRIPGIVLIGDSPALLNKVTVAAGKTCRHVGQTDRADTLLAGRPRCSAAATLHDRVLALILDPSCDALVIGATPQEIEDNGFPLDRCDLALIADSASPSDALRKLIDACAAVVVDGITEHNFDERALPAVRSVTARHGRQGG